jgi:hypothetical protein
VGYDESFQKFPGRLLQMKTDLGEEIPAFFEVQTSKLEIL